MYAHFNTTFTVVSHYLWRFKALKLALLSILIITGCSSDSDPEPLISGITGSVQDEQNNPYMSAEITLDPGNVTTTNIEGEYAFTDLDPGNYTVSLRTPLTSEVIGGNTLQVQLNADQPVNADFRIRNIPVEGHVVLGLTDPLGHVRTIGNEIPSDPNELIYRSGNPPVPITAPDGHHVTLQEWMSTQGTALVTCDGAVTRYELNFTGLIPNGVFTLWNIPFSVSVGPGSGLSGSIGAGSLGAANGSQNAFVAAEDGTAAITLSVIGGNPLSVFGEAPRCTLTDARGLMLVVLYHIDGQTYGPDPGPENTLSDHMIFYI